MSALWSAPEFAQIAELVASRTGLCFTPNRCGTLERAVWQLIREQSLEDLAEFQRRLGSPRAPWQALIQHITVGETYFFRDQAHFDFLKQRILPELSARCGSAYRPRVWSAGCASGEEAYSLAIALDEEGKLDGAFVLGTDLSRAALARASTACYRNWSLRDVEPHVLEKYFQDSQAGSVLSPAVARSVVFHELNLAGSAYPSPLTGTFAMDLILCRNVLIYLNAQVIADVARHLFQCLAPGGYLITGPSDPLLRVPGVEMLHVDAGIAYRRPLTPNWHSEPPALPKQVQPPPSGSPLPNPATRGPSLRSPALETNSDRERRSLEQLRERCNSLPLERVEAECRAALSHHPLSAELHYVHALALLQSSPSAAKAALQRALYLDASVAIVHFTLGSVLVKLGEIGAAERAYRNAERCARACDASERARFAREISAGGLANSAAYEIAKLQRRGAAS